jgi:hypothetical protein
MAIRTRVPWTLLLDKPYRKKPVGVVKDGGPDVSLGAGPIPVLWFVVSSSALSTGAGLV